MTQNIDLSSGGMIACILGAREEIAKDIGTHPNVLLIDGTEEWKSGPPLPPNTKAVVFTTEGLDLARQRAIIAAAVKLDVIYISRRHAVQFADTVRAWLKTANKAEDGDGPKKLAPKGYITSLIEKNPLDPTKSNAEEARRLFEVAKREGQSTTIASLAQGISIYRRAHNLTSKPESLVDPKVRRRLDALKTFDDALAGMQLMRDWIAEVETEIEDLRAFKRRITDIARNPE